MSRRIPLAVLTAIATLVPLVPAAALTPIEVPEAPPKVIVEGTGGGHGVGMSQYGAYGMSRAGSSATQIVKHYYSGATVEATGNNPSKVRVGLGTNYTAVKFVVKDPDAPVTWRQCGEALVPTCTAFTPPGGDSTVDPSWFGKGVTKIALDHGAAEAVVEAPHPYSSSLKRYYYGSLIFRLEDDGKIDLISEQPDLETYLRGLAEVPSSWGTSSNKGMAALEAQAITGRTYALTKFQEGVTTGCDCHLLATPANQHWVGYDKETGAWGDLWVDAVESTEGDFATYNGSLINTYYSASHGGRSENIEDSWAYGTASSPYLKSVSDEAARHPDVHNPYADPWVRYASNGKFAGLLGSGWKNVARIQIVDRTDGGTPRTLRIEAFDKDGNREAFDWGGPNKNIAGASLRTGSIWSGSTVGGYAGDKMPSSQISHIGMEPFTDDDGSAHEYEIARIAAAGLTVGCNASDGGDRFCPDRRLTRAEMATFIVRAFKELKPIEGEKRFSDTPVGATHTAAITALADAGLTNGCGNGKYCPDRKLTRAEMATFLVRVIDGIDPVKGATRFSDVKVGATHTANITAIADAGLTNGCGDGSKYCPDRAVTRGQMASFLVRALTWKP